MSLEKCVKKRIKGLGIALVIACASGCATSKVTLESTPAGSEVYVVGLGQDKAKLLGKTPLTLPAPSIRAESGGAGPITLRFVRDGYFEKDTIVTDLAAVDLTVNVELRPSTGLEDQVKLNSVVNSAFEAQHLARAGRYDDALTRLHELEKAAPQLGAIYELEADVYYLKHKYPEALDAANHALKIDPSSAGPARLRTLLMASLKKQGAIVDEKPNGGAP